MITHLIGISFVISALVALIGAPIAAMTDNHEEGTK
jgi:hypothetical protein